jgi:hypothetical protein
MAEIELILTVYTTDISSESTELLFPIPMNIVGNISSLHQRVSSGSRPTNIRIRRYLILLLENIETESDYHYGQLEANPQVLAIFLQWNDSYRPPTNITKLYYVPTSLLTQVVSLAAVQVFKTEAERQLKETHNSLVELYLRKARGIKDWMKNTMRVRISRRHEINNMKEIHCFLGSTLPCLSHTIEHDI